MFHEAQLCPRHQQPAASNRVNFYLARDFLRGGGPLAQSFEDAEFTGRNKRLCAAIAGDKFRQTIERLYGRNVRLFCNSGLLGRHVLESSLQGRLHEGEGRSPKAFIKFSLAVHFARFLHVLHSRSMFANTALRIHRS